MTGTTVSKRTEAKPTRTVVEAEAKSKRTLRDVVKEPSTIAGVSSIVSQVLMAGPGALVNPGVWAGVLAGVGLILTREGS